MDFEVWKIFNVGIKSTGVLVSNFGNIKAFDWSDKKIGDNGAGYKKIAVHNIGGGLPRMKNMYVHRLVAELFCDKTSCDKTQINHKDGDKNNNHYMNLEWVSPKENIAHMHKEGLNKNRRLLGTTKTQPDSVILNAYLCFKIGLLGVNETAIKFGMPRTTMSSIVNKRSRRSITDFVDTHFGFN